MLNLQEYSISQNEKNQNYLFIYLFIYLLDKHMSKLPAQGSTVFPLVSNKNLRPFLTKLLLWLKILSFVQSSIDTYGILICTAIMHRTDSNDRIGCPCWFCQSSSSVPKRGEFLLQNSRSFVPFLFCAALLVALRKLAARVLRSRSVLLPFACVGIAWEQKHQTERWKEMADLVDKAWQRHLIALHKHPLRTKVNDSSLFSFFLSLSLPSARSCCK
jgi:hypothetical protein